MKELSIELYRKLYLIRRAEKAIQQHYFNNDMKTPMHMSMGQEAIVAGICHAMSAKDQVLGSYRSHALYLAKTGETDRFFAEMFGRATGTAKGKGGSMHLMAPEQGLICTTAIVGTQIPVALGAAFANKCSHNGKVVAVFFGDGAIDEGVFWESLNSACLYKLPIIMVCEDNDCAVHTPRSVRHGYTNISKIAAEFNCSVYSSDSTDVEKIHSITTEALASMRKTARPAFMHLKYYRYLEHVGVSEDFKAGYRPKAEFDKWMAVDPVVLQRKRLSDIITAGDISAIEQQIDAQIETSVALAAAAPFPTREVLMEDVIA